MRERERERERETKRVFFIYRYKVSVRFKLLRFLSLSRFSILFNIIITLIKIGLT